MSYGTKILSFLLELDHSRLEQALSTQTVNFWEPVKAEAGYHRSQYDFIVGTQAILFRQLIGSSNVEVVEIQGYVTLCCVRSRIQLKITDDLHPLTYKDEF